MDTSDTGPSETPESHPENARDVTIVLPAFNEEATICGSYEQISAVMDRTDLTYEILFVDDGSSDGTWQVIKEICHKDPGVHGVRHRGNFGKASALANGFTYARGCIIVTCDADLQYDANDIVRLIDKVREGFDAVSANKVVRRDPLSRRLPSKFFNLFVRDTTGVQLHDMNAGLKAFRRDAAHGLVRYGYGELHRFFLVILAKKGYCVGEVSVESCPRVSGRSKYGLERYMRGALDFLTVFFLSGYVDRPLHFFGGIALAMCGIGTAIMAYTAVAAIALAGRVPTGGLLELAALLILSGTQLFVVGLVAEMVTNLDRAPSSRTEVSAVIGVERRTRPDARVDAVCERRRCAPGSG